MALNKILFEKKLKNKLSAITPTDGDVVGKVAKIIADEVDAYIRSQTITVTTTVTGTCVTPAGAGTIAGSGSGTGNIT